MPQKMELVTQTQVPEWGHDGSAQHAVPGGARSSQVVFGAEPGPGSPRSHSQAPGGPMHTTTVGEEEPWHALPARVARVTSPRTAARMNASLLHAPGRAGLQ